MHVCSVTTLGCSVSTQQVHYRKWWVYAGCSVSAHCDQWPHMAFQRVYAMIRDGPWLFGECILWLVTAHGFCTFLGFLVLSNCNSRENCRWLAWLCPLPLSLLAFSLAVWVSSCRSNSLNCAWWREWGCFLSSFVVHVFALFPPQEILSLQVAQIAFESSVGQIA